MYGHLSSLGICSGSGMGVRLMKASLAPTREDCPVAASVPDTRDPDSEANDDDDNQNQE